MNMETTTLDPSFLRAVVLMTAFKPKPATRAEGALLLIGLNSEQFTAADLPAEVTDGSRYLAGIATGALISIKLLKVVGRVKSPDPKANGRKLDLLKLTSTRKAKAWLRANNINYREVEKPQGRLF